MKLPVQAKTFLPAPLWSPWPFSCLTGGGALERGGASLPGFQSQREILSSGQPLTAGGASCPLLPLLPLMMIVRVYICFTEFASSQEAEETAGCTCSIPPSSPSPLTTPTPKTSAHLQRESPLAATTASCVWSGQPTSDTSEPKGSSSLVPVTNQKLRLDLCLPPGGVLL